MEAELVDRRWVAAGHQLRPALLESPERTREQVTGSADEVDSGCVRLLEKDGSAQRVARRCEIQPTSYARRSDQGTDHGAPLGRYAVKEGNRPNQGKVAGVLTDGEHTTRVGCAGAEAADP